MTVSNGGWLVIPHYTVSGAYYFLCSACGKLGVITTAKYADVMKFCPHCGAQMKAPGEACFLKEDVWR